MPELCNSCQPMSSLRMRGVPQGHLLGTAISQGTGEQVGGRRDHQGRRGVQKTDCGILHLLFITVI